MRVLDLSTAEFQASVLESGLGFLGGKKKKELPLLEQLA